MLYSIGLEPLPCLFVYDQIDWKFAVRLIASKKYVRGGFGAEANAA